MKKPALLEAEPTLAELRWWEAEERPRRRAVQWRNALLFQSAPVAAGMLVKAWVEGTSLIAALGVGAFTGACIGAGIMLLAGANDHDTRLHAIRLRRLQQHLDAPPDE